MDSEKEAQKPVNHDGKWAKEEEEEDSNEVHAVSFYPRTELVEPLKWKAPENRLKLSCVKPSKLKLKELPKCLEYAFLQENNQFPPVISSALSTTKKDRILKSLGNSGPGCPKEGRNDVVKNVNDESSIKDDHMDCGKSGARLSGGHFIGRLAHHLGLVSDDRLSGLSVMARELPLIDMSELVKLNICMEIGYDWA
ncbi:hypothetical protein Tco_0650264 [Tanacetum coccineum]